MAELRAIPHCVPTQKPGGITYHPAKPDYSIGDLLAMGTWVMLPYFRGYLGRYLPIVPNYDGIRDGSFT